MFVALPVRSNEVMEDPAAENQYKKKWTPICGSVVVTRYPLYSSTNLRMLKAVRNVELEGILDSTTRGVIFFSVLDEGKAVNPYNS